MGAAWPERACFQAELLLRKSGFGFVRLGLSCVVNRNRKVGANSPGAIGTITIQWWLYPLQELGGVRGALEYQLPVEPATLASTA